MHQMNRRLLFRSPVWHVALVNPFVGIIYLNDGALLCNKLVILNPSQYTPYCAAVICRAKNGRLDMSCFQVHIPRPVCQILCLSILLLWKWRIPQWGFLCDRGWCLHLHGLIFTWMLELVVIYSYCNLNILYVLDTHIHTIFQRHRWSFSTAQS